MLERTLYRTPRPRRQRASAGRHFRNGHRAAVVRAVTGARLYLDGRVSSLAAAAEACGSNINYIRAAVALLKADDPEILDLALEGWCSLSTAADYARLHRKTESITVTEAVASWRVWTPEQRAEFGRGAGVADIWDHAISPVITDEREVVHDYPLSVTALGADSLWQGIACARLSHLSNSHRNQLHLRRNGAVVRLYLRSA
jgi:hypothetical protein